MLNAGDKFNKLTVVKYDHKNKSFAKFYLCKCDCGNTVVVNGSSLKSGHTKSCGCYLKEVRQKHPNHATHRMSKQPFYYTWSKMKQRCLNPNDKEYERYGGRGITIADRWLIFENFAEDMLSSYLEHYSFNDGDTTLERINVNEGYYPENCRWATAKEQANNRRTNILVRENSNEPFITLKEWCERNNKNYKKVWGIYKKQTFLDGLEIYKRGELNGEAS